MLYPLIVGALLFKLIKQTQRLEIEGFTCLVLQLPCLLRGARHGWHSVAKSGGENTSMPNPKAQKTNG